MRSSTRRLTGLGVLAVVGSLVIPSMASAQSPSAAAPAGSAGSLANCKVGVSWNNFQQPRWAATDKPSMFKVIQDGGATILPDKDANLSTTQQITDVNTLIEQGANVLILLAQDTKAIGPALQAAKDNNIPVIAYDRLIEDPDVLYITFDNQGVGVAEATAIMQKVPEGNYVIIKGDPGDPNAAIFLRNGYDVAGLKDAVDAGKIKILDEQFTPGWDTKKAQTTMEAIIDKANADGNTIDAVLAENDSTSLGVAAALQAKSYDPYPPTSGQDGDPANLNNVAKGLQYVDVWKNSNELGKMAGSAALQLCAGKTFDQITTPDGLDPTVATMGAGANATDFVTPGLDGKPSSGDENTVKSFIFTPTPITADNLNLVLEGNWITKDKLCAGVDAATAPAACK
jgi:D-xylose transport system substrate-binding protein